jgi:hypothetical protein
VLDVLECSEPRCLLVARVDSNATARRPRPSLRLFPNSLERVLLLPAEGRGAGGRGGSVCSMVFECSEPPSVSWSSGGVLMC